MNHNPLTLSERHCELCCYQRAHDEFEHGRVDNFYLRGHLRALAEDRGLPLSIRMAAAKELTHPSYPAETRRTAGLALLRLADAAGGLRSWSE